MIRTKSLILLFSVLSFIYGLGCSQVGFMKSNQEEQSSLSEPIDPLATLTPTPTPLPPAAVTVAYPSYAKVANVPYLYAQSEILINPQDDNTTCIISAFIGPMENNLCLDVPDLCWTSPVNTVTKENDYTCAQAFRGKEILNAKGGVACGEDTQALSAEELAQLNDPALYKVVTGAVDPSGAVPDPTIALPSLNAISITSDCRCHYISNDVPTFLYKYPAMESHCRNHFGDIYQ